ncbi:hypothetical protein PR202_gb07883 [Eleusine coracana subsp. coracana]|uniref:Uncharacterized protein n=1 Tax=Eleusine coracana subsp. coracana TaxID=191504 RepID=A0AAV5EDQ9_ELECO|nr:hypothetical protein PR202_gb07883 [Eleusine coracana subsp. coracana]
MPFRKLEHIVRRFDRPTVQECFFTFSASAASVNKLKGEGQQRDGWQGHIRHLLSPSAPSAPLSCRVRARRLPPEEGTFYYVVIGYRGRVSGIPSGYIGNAMVSSKAESTAGEIVRREEWARVDRAADQSRRGIV